MAREDRYIPGNNIQVVAGERVSVERVPTGYVATVIEQPWVWEVGRSQAAAIGKIADAINGVTPGTGYQPPEERGE